MLRDLTAEELERYSRQLILDGVGARGQARLRASSIFVVGAGGLGSPALLYLAAAGVGRIAIADPDEVELSNLARQILYSTEDLGRPKAEVAASALLRLNPTIDVRSCRDQVTAENIAELSADYDLLLDGSDSFAAKFALNDEALRTRRSCVIGSVLGFEGQVMAVVPGRTPCLRCIFEDEPAPGTALSCRAAGVLGPLVGVIGSLQAAEAIKLLLDPAGPEAGGILHVDLMNSRFRKIQFHARAGCIACESAVTSL